MEKIGDHFREGMKMYLDGCFDYAPGEWHIRYNVHYIRARYSILKAIV